MLLINSKKNSTQHQQDVNYLVLEVLSNFRPLDQRHIKERNMVDRKNKRRKEQLNTDVQSPLKVIE